MAVIAPVWARSLSTFPDVQLEVHADEALVGIVAKGFDAGISSKDLAAADMIAVCVIAFIDMLRTAHGSAPVKARSRTPSRLIECARRRRRCRSPRANASGRAGYS
jgi:hypothetical protein